MLWFSSLPTRTPWTDGGGCRVPDVGSSRGRPFPSLAGAEHPAASCGWLRGCGLATVSRHAPQVPPSCVGLAPAASADSGSRDCRRAPPKMKPKAGDNKQVALAERACSNEYLDFVNLAGKSWRYDIGLDSGEQTGENKARLWRVRDENVVRFWRD